MISFFCLLEGDVCSHNLWWDHSELADHSNCCTALCSLQIRSMGGISRFFLFLFFYFSVAEQLKKDKVEIFPECCIAPCPAQCTEEAGREDEKSCWTNSVSPNCSENRGSTESATSKQWGWRRQSCLPFLRKLQNCYYSIWFLFLSRKMLFRVGKAFYKYTLFMILLELICYAEFRSIKWKKGGKIPRDKRNQRAVHSRINTALLDVVQALFVPGFPTGVPAHPGTLFVFCKLADGSLVQRRKCSHIRSCVSLSLFPLWY